MMSVKAVLVLGRTTSVWLKKEVIVQRCHDPSLTVPTT